MASSPPNPNPNPNPAQEQQPETVVGQNGDAPSRPAPAGKARGPGGPAPAPAPEEGLHGFGRTEMYSASLPGSVHPYERHVFLCYKDPSSWPPMLETAQSEPLPHALAAALKARKDAMLIKTRLTICNKEDGADSSDGDVLIFPDMVRYNGLTHTDVETFVDEVLMQNKEWQSGKPEKLEGAHIFVCAHGSRDARCGFCGPSLIKKFQEELSTSSLEGHAFVRSCSHVGGHKYAGNVIIYSQDSLGKMAGNWYGYVTPEDVPLLLNEHIGKGEIIDRIWRGQMGMTEEEQKQAHQSRILQCKATEKDENGCMCSGAVGGDGSVDKNGQAEELSKARGGEEKKKGQPSWCKMSNWLDGWDKQDTITAAVVIGAATSVAVAFYLTRRSSQTK